MAQPQPKAAPHCATSSPRCSPWEAAAGCGVGLRGAGGRGEGCAGAEHVPSAPLRSHCGAGGSPGAPLPAQRPAGMGTAMHGEGHVWGTGTAMHGDSHACSMGMAIRKAWGTVAAEAGDTHWEVGVAGPVARGLLSLVGVVVKGCAEEAGLHLVTLPAHEVGAAGTGPVLHGAPGEWPSSIFLSDCASPIPPLSPSLHLHAQRSLLPHQSVSTVKPRPHPSSNGPTTPILPCPHPHPCVPEPCWAVLQGLTGCCRLPRSHRSMAGSPLHHSSGPRTQAAVRWERWGVGVGPAQPWGCHGAGESQGNGARCGAGALTTHWLQERPATKRLQ